MSVDKAAPQAIDAELSVLGSLLIDGAAAAKVSDLLTPDDFYRPMHADIFAAAMHLFEQREPIDLITMRQEIEQRGLAEKIPTATLARLQEEVPTTVRVEYYAKAVANAARRRRLIAVAGKIAVAAQEEQDADAAEDRAMTELLATLSSRRRGIDFLTPADQANVLTDLLERRQEGVSPGILTGLDSLDNATGGMRHGDLIVIAARPSAGKSSLAETIAENVAGQGYRVAFVSIEMDRDTVAHRFAARSGVIPVSALIRGPRHDAEWSAAYTLAEARGKLPLYLFDAASASSTSIRAGILREQLKLGFPFDLIVVDYLQLIKDPLVKGQNSADRIGMISGAMKSLARELRVPVILLSQLNRDSEHRNDREPQLSDLKGSGDIEQDADLVIFLWTHEVQPDVLDTYIKIGKQRNGPVGDLKNITFDRKHFKYENAR